MTITFQKASRKQAKARVALSGPSGSGKTYSALGIAAGLGERIAVIDTEHGSASLYADQFDFDVVELGPPYTPVRYVEAVNAAVQLGYDVVLIDSITHSWSGQGGVLDIVNAAGGRFQDWQKGSPLWQQLLDSILQCPAHVVVTVRAKTAYEVADGGKKVEKLGLAPEARAGLEYEFTIFGELSLAHSLSITKSRMKDLQDAVVSRPDSSLGERIAAWLNEGEEPKRLEWLEDLCDTFGIGETMDAINEFRVKSGKQPLVSPTQVADVPEERVALLRSHLEDKAKAVEAESPSGDPDAESSSTGEGVDAPTRSDSSVAGGGDQAAATPDSAPDDPSSRNGKSDPSEALERAKGAAAKKGKKALEQAELADGSLSQARGDDPSAQVPEVTNA
jgi:hypothetical protein